MSRATTVSNQEAVRIAIENGVAIQFDEVAMLPFFRYEKNGQQHEVWFAGNGVLADHAVFPPELAVA